MMQLTFPDFDDSELALVKQCLGSRWVTQGPMVARFEALVAERQGCAHALATTSCTAALHLAMLALGLGPGDEVIVPAFTWVTTAHAAEYVGAKAVFVDIDGGSYNLDPAALEAAITPATRAIVAVHLFGLAADMAAVLEIARRHDLAVVEDAACGIGTSCDGRPVGAIGDIGCFSFHPRKIVSTGEGGMVTSNRDDLAAKVGVLRNHGSSGLSPEERAAPKPHSMARFETLGYNLRMPDILGAVGVAQMAKLDRLLAERRRLAAQYCELLADHDRISLPANPNQAPGHSYQSFVIRLREDGVQRRNAVMERLQERGIQTRPGTHAVHCLDYYARKYGLRAEDCPRAALCADTTITLPLFPGMTEANVERVARELAQALQ